MSDSSTLLALDIGNSAVKATVFSDDGTEAPLRLTPPDRADEWPDWFRDLFAHHRDARLAYASVVPPRAAAAESAARALGRSLFAVSASAVLPMTIAYATPQTLGADRIAAAAAAWTDYGRRGDRPVVAVDAGTAVTYEVIDAGGVYLGGAIAPGPTLLRKSLTGGTAQLPDVSFDLPPGPIGRSTHEAIQSGLLFGFIDGAEGMLTRIEQTLGVTPHVVLTGGWGARLQQALQRPATFTPGLVLRGVRIIAAMNTF